MNQFSYLIVQVKDLYNLWHHDLKGSQYDLDSFLKFIDAYSFSENHIDEAIEKLLKETKIKLHKEIFS
jgi:hypothetical protein